MTDEKTRVLIVNNDKQDLAHLTSVLEETGYIIQTATNGQEALEKIDTTSPHLILLDLEMPMDGYETANNLRHIRKNSMIPILFLVDPARKNGYEDISDWEATGILRKPYYPFDVISRCKALLNLQKYESELEIAGQVIESLALSVEARDPTTGNHCDRLFFRLAKMADVLGLGNEVKDTLLRGAVLHDIGKIGVPDNILLKEGPLTDREWEVMRRHVTIGEALCKPLKFLNSVLPLIRHHHERFDGGGYPDGLEGNAIPLVARVFQICDIYDALTNPRPYKPAFSTEEAVRIMEHETTKGWRDPGLVDTFLRMVREESA